MNVTRTEISAAARAARHSRKHHLFMVGIIMADDARCGKEWGLHSAREHAAAAWADELEAGQLSRECDAMPRPTLTAA